MLPGISHPTNFSVIQIFRGKFGNYYTLIGHSWALHSICHGKLTFFPICWVWVKCCLAVVIQQTSLLSKYFVENLGIIIRSLDIAEPYIRFVMQMRLMLDDAKLCLTDRNLVFCSSMIQRRVLWIVWNKICDKESNSLSELNFKMINFVQKLSIIHYNITPKKWRMRDSLTFIQFYQDSCGTNFCV